MCAPQVETGDTVFTQKPAPIQLLDESDRSWRKSATGLLGNGRGQRNQVQAGQRISCKRTCI